MGGQRTRIGRSEDLHWEVRGTAFEEGDFQAKGAHIRSKGAKSGQGTPQKFQRVLIRSSEPTSGQDGRKQVKVAHIWGEGGPTSGQ